MAGYSRQSAGLITDSQNIEASHFNNEFNQLVAAFSAVSGHKHDGTANEGPRLTPQALNGLVADGVVVRTGTDNFIARAITGTANQITVTNGNGVSDNPTLSFPASVVFPGTVSSTGFTGPLTGNVTGNVTGDVTGSLVGNASTATTLSSTLPVILGGTGATSAANARTNLDVYSKAEVNALDNTLNTAIAAAQADATVAKTVTDTITATGTSLITAADDVAARTAINAASVADLWTGNRIINGDMTIFQRGNVATVTTGKHYTVDRWGISLNGGGGQLKQTQSDLAPPGFRKSLVTSVVTPDTSLAASDYYLIDYMIEGNDIRDLDWGLPSAAPVTLSFWVLSSLPGTYAVSLRNGDSSRSYVHLFTINNPNTWEYKTATIPGDTTGAWAVDVTLGLRILFDLGSGSNFNAPVAGVWASGNTLRTAGTVNFASNAGAAIRITGVQLEKGSFATPFRFVPFADSLQRCERYYQSHASMLLSGYSVSNGVIYQNFSYTTNMRVTPSVSVSNVVYSNMTNIAVNGARASNTQFRANIVSGPNNGWVVYDAQFNAEL